MSGHGSKRSFFFGCGHIPFEMIDSDLRQSLQRLAQFTNRLSRSRANFAFPEQDDFFLNGPISKNAPETNIEP